MAFHCHVVLEKSVAPATTTASAATTANTKCVSQSSSSGLGSEHSGQQSLRCYCSPSGRTRRCRLRSHRMRVGEGGTPLVTDIDVGEGPHHQGGVKYASGGHASSGYESVLRDDSEFSSQSSSGGSFPPAQAKEAACQTMPCDVGPNSGARFARQPPAENANAPSLSGADLLATSFTDTVTANGDTMLASITSRSKLALRYTQHQSSLGVFGIQCIVLISYVTCYLNQDF